MQVFELERKRVRNGFLLASFPGHSHRQYCMQIQGGGALGDQVTCNRQRVEGALPKRFNTYLFHVDSTLAL